MSQRDPAPQDARSDKPGFADDRQVSNPVWYGFWFFFALFIVWSLSGCATPPTLLKGSGQPAPALPGYSKLCADRPDLSSCNAARLDTLQHLNLAINALPFDIARADDWTPITERGAGTCTSFATAKFEALAAAGWPRNALRLAYVLTETYEHHLVLLVDLDGQTWVLDNRYPYPMTPAQLGYTWLRLQVPSTARWEFAAFAQPTAEERS